MSSLAVTEPTKTQHSADLHRFGMAGWLTRRSFRSRITMLVVAAVGLSVAIGALISYLSISRAITGRVDDNLKSRSQLLLSTNLACLSTTSMPNGIDSQGATVALSLAGLRATIVNADGSAFEPTPTQVANGQTLDAVAPVGTPELTVAAGQNTFSLRTVEFNGQPYRVYAVRTSHAIRSRTARCPRTPRWSSPPRWPRPSPRWARSRPSRSSSG